MSKKKTTKKVAKKSEKPSIPAEAGVPTETPLQAARKAGMSKSKVEAPEAPTYEDRQSQLSDSDKQMVMVQVDVPLQLNNIEFEVGQHQVPAHVATQLRHMLWRKKKADEAVHVGRNFKWNRGSGRKHVVTKHEGL